MGKSLIHEFAAVGDLAGVLAELDAGADINARHPANDHTPLMTAVAQPNAKADFVRALLKRGANVNQFASDSTLAANMHRMENLDAFLQSPGDSPMADSRFDDLREMFAKLKAMFGEMGDLDLTQKENALSLALKVGDPDVVAALLEAGADTKYTRPGGYDALIDAIHGRESIIQMLIDRGALLNTISDYSESALRIASHIGRFNVIRMLLDAGADPAPLEWTPLMHAVGMGSLQDVARELQAGADLSAQDSWSRTPFLLSVATGAVEKAKLLLAAGSDRRAVGRCGKPPVMYPLEHDDSTMLRWLLDEGFDPEALDEFGHSPLKEAAEKGATQCVKTLIEAGVDIHRGKDVYERAIRNACNLEIVRLLVSHGANLNDISDEMRALLTGQKLDAPILASQEEFNAAKTRRFGTANPEKMDHAFWNAMVASGAIAYAAREKFDDARDLNEPIWCFRRFGKSINELPDGRIIEIGGEHEDYYDADFCIYNDVIVHHGGGKFDIHGYPRDIFPPTDFHSATLIGNHLYIIGSAGYSGERQHGDTPVYRLDTTTLEIASVPTSGEKPGWISGHAATLLDGDKIKITGANLYTLNDGKEDYVSNSSEFVLDLATLIWRRIENR